MYSVTKRFIFEAAHVLSKYSGKCRNIHGHTYVAEVTFQAKKLNQEGMVVDFSKLKNIIGFWIDANWDHSILLNKDDPLVEVLKAYKKDAKVFFIDGDPTAEKMAEVLFRKFICVTEHFGDAKLFNVRIYETPTSWADYSE